MIAGPRQRKAEAGRKRGEEIRALLKVVLEKLREDPEWTRGVVAG